MFMSESKKDENSYKSYSVDFGHLQTAKNYLKTLFNKTIEL